MRPSSLLIELRLDIKAVAPAKHDLADGRVIDEALCADLIGLAIARHDDLCEFGSLPHQTASGADRLMQVKRLERNRHKLGLPDLTADGDALRVELSDFQ